MLPLGWPSDMFRDIWGDGRQNAYSGSLLHSTLDAGGGGRATLCTSAVRCDGVQSFKDGTRAFHSHRSWFRGDGAGFSGS